MYSYGGSVGNFQYLIQVRLLRALWAGLQRDCSPPAPDSVSAWPAAT